MKFREHLRLQEAKAAFKVGDKITWKNDDGDTMTGTIEKMGKDFSGVKVFKIKTKMNNKGKEVLTTWPVGEILRKASLLKESVDECDHEEDETCESCESIKEETEEEEEDEEKEDDEDEDEEDD
jgi:hypothetical protein